MPFLLFIEIFITLSVLVLIGTQIVWPALAGGKWFPMFRRRDLEDERRVAEEELNRAKQEVEIASIKDQVEHIKHDVPCERRK